MIERQKSKYGWEFLFLGANIDAVEAARTFGISEDRAVNYHADSKGTRPNYEVVGSAIAGVRCGAPCALIGRLRLKLILKHARERNDRIGFDAVSSIYPAAPFTRGAVFLIGGRGFLYIKINCSSIDTTNHRGYNECESKGGG